MHKAFKPPCIEFNSELQVIFIRLLIKLNEPKTFKTNITEPLNVKLVTGDW